MKKKQGTDSLPFARILREIMRERRLTVRAVAGMAEVRGSVVQGWLAGANPHDLRAVERLSRALGVGFQPLLLGDEVPVTPKGAPDGFLEHEFFDGLCRVTIKKLVRKA